MKIAQVAPLYESVPPKTYGGTERVVHYLTEELISNGHEVTLFATGDSQTSARLYAAIEQPIRNSIERRDPIASHTIEMAQLLEEIAEYDMVHFHTDYLQFMIDNFIKTPHITTIHGRIDSLDYTEIFKQFSNVPVVSISQSQRQPVTKANWVGCVYNGIPAKNFTFEKIANDGYLVFIGRFSPEKNPKEAIEMAIQSNMPLKLAAKVDDCDYDYYTAEILPYLSHPLIEYVGEVDEFEKNKLLGGATALLFPIRWPEPFGLVMVEAMACGTPVIAYDDGAVREVMVHNETGFIVHTFDEGLMAIKNISSISRQQCRLHFEKNFSAQAMAQNYLKVYQQQIVDQNAAILTPIFDRNESKVLA